LPFGGTADAEASTLVIRKCRSKPTLVPLDGLDAVAAAIARAKLVIGVRLHALILAIRFGIPFSGGTLRSEDHGAADGRAVSASNRSGRRVRACVPKRIEACSTIRCGSARTELAAHLALQAAVQRRGPRRTSGARALLRRAS
jgi:hypothetical protein